eukprot:m.1019247 g.1019247  ORF g.1019247 m.1019247 type:complete len:952 (-) comp24086_c0_seq46:4053-6908(-)
MNVTGGVNDTASAIGVLEIKGVLRYDFEDAVHGAANLLKTEQHYKWLTPPGCSSHINSVTIEFCEMSQIQAIKVVNAYSKFIEVKVGAKTPEGYSYSTLLSKQTLMPGLTTSQPFATKTFSKELSEKWSARKWDRVRIEVSVLKNLGRTSADNDATVPFGLSLIEFYGPTPRKFRLAKQNTPQMMLLSRASLARRSLTGIEKTDSHQFLARLRRKNNGEVPLGSSAQQSKATRALLRVQAKAHEDSLAAHPPRAPDGAPDKGSAGPSHVPWTQARLLDAVCGFNDAFSTRINTMMGTYADSVPAVRRASIRDELLGEHALPPHNVWAAKGFWWDGHAGYKPPLHRRAGADATPSSVAPQATGSAPTSGTGNRHCRKRTTSDSDIDSDADHATHTRRPAVHRPRKRTTTPSAVSPAGRHNEMGRVRCKYGAECYQKNPEHRRKFWHGHAPAARSTARASAEPSLDPSAGTAPRRQSASHVVPRAEPATPDAGRHTTLGRECSSATSDSEQEPLRATATYDDDTCSDSEEAENNTLSVPTHPSAACTRTPSVRANTDTRDGSPLHDAPTNDSNNDPTDLDTECTPTCMVCGNATRRLTVRKPGANFGRPFYTCTSTCNFFLWGDSTKTSASDAAHGPVSTLERTAPLAPRRRRQTAVRHHVDVKTPTAHKASATTAATPPSAAKPLPKARTALSPREATSTSTAPFNTASHRDAPKCGCGQAANARTVQKEGPNKGRPFFTCASCSFFQWGDVATPNVPEVVCKCSKPARVCVVRKDGHNKGRSFHTCATCNFFQWVAQASSSQHAQRGGDDTAATHPAASPSPACPAREGGTAPVFCGSGRSDTTTARSAAAPTTAPSVPEPAIPLKSSNPSVTSSLGASVGTNVFTIVDSGDESAGDVASPTRTSAATLGSTVWPDSDGCEDVAMVACPICAQAFEACIIAIHSATCTNYT